VSELVLSGFDALPAAIIPTQVVAVVRYRTSAASTETPDGHFFEVSVDGSFAAPGVEVTDWNAVVPIVGAGTNAPAPNALPHVPEWREVRATVSRNLRDDGRAVGRYRFDPPDWTDIANLAIRLRTTTRGVPDAVDIEWDAAWLEVYGYRASGPLNVYRSAVSDQLVDPANAVGAATLGPFDTVAPASPILFYAVDDGSGSNPAVIWMVAEPGALARIYW
jgi:hypothetical protein